MTNIEPEETQPFRPNQPGENPEETRLVGESHSEGNLNETIPVMTDNTVQVSANTDRLPDSGKKFKKKRWPIIVGGVLLILILGATGGWMGYTTGINLRIQQEEGSVAMVAATQFALAEQDILNGKLETAKRRLEYVIQVDPSFPGAAETLSKVMLDLAIKYKPTEVATPTVSPTPDLRGEEEMFAQIEQHMRASDWDNAIASIEAIRVKNPEYRVVDVDGFYYIALRNRGVNKIINQGSLELGIYDLAVVSQFGPVDREADGYRNWARSYLSGISFWGVDWGKVVEYFEQMYASLPNLHDSSGFTAAERYRQAAIGYADQLALAEDWCTADYYYQTALQIGADPNVSPTASWVYNECNPPTEVPQAQPTREKTTEVDPTQETVQPTEETPQPEMTEMPAIVP